MKVIKIKADKFSKYPELFLSFFIVASQQNDNISFNQALLADLEKKISKEYPIFSDFFISTQRHTKNITVLRRLPTNSSRVVVKNNDGLITDLKNVAAVVKTADCLPVIMYDYKKQVVGIIHAGYKGILQEIGAETIKKMKNIFASQADNILIFVGPGIGSCCYEATTDAQKVALFAKKYAHGVVKRRKGKIYLDLKEALRQQLQTSGIPGKNIQIVDVCTACNNKLPSHFKEGLQRKNIILAVTGIKAAPNFKEGLMLLKKYQLSPALISHSKKVSSFAYNFARRLKNKKRKVNPEYVRIVALLHDIGKTRKFTLIKNHAIKGKKILTNEGYGKAGETVEKHMIVDSKNKEFLPLSLEEKLVYYSDKRVSGSRVVSLDCRLRDLQRRHKKYRQVIIAATPYTKNIEQEIKKLLKK